MSAFRALHNVASGMSVGQRWIDTISHNMANLNTDTRVGDEPFRARYLVISENVGGETGLGVQLRSVVRAEGDAPIRFDPQHPLALSQDADADGLLDEEWREVDAATGQWVAERVRQEPQRRSEDGSVVVPEQERLLVAAAADGEEMVGVAPDGETVPLEDLQFVMDGDAPVGMVGMVQGALVDLGGQMSDLIIAQRYFQANSRVITAAKEAYESALRIGRS